jgi:hypothetical protein
MKKKLICLILALILSATFVPNSNATKKPKYPKSHTSHVSPAFRLQKPRSSKDDIPIYPGKHDKSHGGKFPNGRGSSHSGGRYINPNGGSRYGKHSGNDEPKSTPKPRSHKSKSGKSKKRQ